MICDEINCILCCLDIVRNQMESELHLFLGNQNSQLICTYLKKREMDQNQINHTGYIFIYK